MKLTKEDFHEYLSKTVEDVREELDNKDMSTIQIENFLLNSLIFVHRLEKNIFKNDKNEED